MSRRDASYGRDKGTTRITSKPKFLEWELHLKGSPNNWQLRTLLATTIRMQGSHKLELSVAKCDMPRMAYGRDKGTTQITSKPKFLEWELRLKGNPNNWQLGTLLAATITGGAIQM